MRRFKTKLFTLISALILSCSCFLFAPQEGVEVKADTQKDVNQSASKNFTLNENFAQTTNENVASKNLEYKLYVDNDSNDDTSNYYNINVENFSTKSTSKNVSKNSIYVNVLWGVSGTISTTVNIDNQNLQKSIDNGMLSIQLKTDFESHHTGTVTLTNGSNKSTKDGSTSSSQILSDLITVTSYQSDISFYAKGSTAFPVDYFVIDIKNPTIILTTTDVVAPTAELTSDMNNLEWSGEESRTITFEVTDNGVGVQKTLVYDQSGNEITPTLVSMSADTKTAKYSFTASYGNSYYVKTWDNVNNVSEMKSLISADDLKLDRTSGILAINPIETLHNNDLKVKFNYTSDKKSSETLYYKIMNETDFYDVASETGTGSNDKVSKTNCDGFIDVGQLGEEATIDFENIMPDATDESNYVICAIVIDAVGNKSGMSYQTFKYDSRRFVVDIRIDGGTLDGEISGTEIKSDELGETLPHAWAGTPVSFKYTPNEGYEFYEILRYKMEKTESGEYRRTGDGVPQSGNTISTKFTYTCGDNYSFDVKFRYIVTLSPKQTEFEYLVDDSGEGKAQAIDFTLNDKFAEGCTGTNAEAIDKSIISFSYTLNGNSVVAIKDAGTYTVTWAIASDNRDYKGSGSFEVVVNRKVVTLSYSNTSGLVYNGNEQSIGVEFAGDNLNDVEKANLILDTKYYLNTDTECKNAVLLCDAGEYFAKVGLNNNNYVISNDKSDMFVIAKKSIYVTYGALEFDYTASIQAIEYTLSENIDVDIVYYIGENEAEFKNASDYTFEILPKDTKNYVLTNNSGSAKILKVNAYFALAKTIYDYTGSVFGLEDIKFVVKNGEGEDASEVIVNGLSFEAFIGEQKTDIQAPDTLYQLVFKTSDENYNLYNTTFEIQVVTTELKISVTSDYEYTGKAIEFGYVVKNQYDEVLNNVSGLNYTISYGDSTISEIKAVGEYSYIFKTDDPKFKLTGGTGTFRVNVTKVKVTMNTLNYTYNSNYDYTISYTATSLGGLSLTESVELVLDKSLGNAGTYAFGFRLKSADDEGSIVIESVEDAFGNALSDDQMVIVIAPMEVGYLVDTNYTYNFGNEIQLIRRRLTEADLSEENVVFEIGEIIDKGEYEGKVYSSDPNYYISIDGCESVDGKVVFKIVVDSYKINVLGASDEEATYIYEYCGNEIVPTIRLSHKFDEYLIYCQNTESIANIVAVGEYQLELHSINPNFEIVGSAVLRVTPRKVSIVVDKDTLEQTYAKNVKHISYKIYDGEDVINIDSKIKYFVFGDDEKKTAYPYLVGSYGFEIVVTGNYEGRLESDDDTALVITKKAIDLTVTPNQFKVYGDEDGEIEYTLAGVCQGDHIDISLGRQEGEDVGKYEVILNSTEFDNYTINYVVTYFQITPKRVVIVADAKTKTFGEVDPEFTYKLILNNAFVTSLLGDDKFEGTLEREEGENVGEYEIALGTLANENYDIIYTGNYLEILQKDVEVSISDTSVIYGESGDLCYTIDKEYLGLISGELEREEGEDVGEYEIGLGSLEISNPNYNLVCTRFGSYTILKSKITVIALPQTKVYGEAEELEYLALGLIGNDTLYGSLSREPGEDVGVYKINIGSLNNDNYDINFIASQMVITKAGISIVIDNKTQVYGNKPAELTYSVTGLKNNDTLNVVLKKIGGNDAGTYEIYGQFNIPSNYYLENYNTGTYTIEKADIEISLEPKSVSYTGKSIEVVASDCDLPLRYIYTKFGEVVDEIRAVGTYKAKAIFDGNNNYNPTTSEEVSVVVSAQEIHITLGKTEFIYDGEAKYPEFGYDKTLGLNNNQFEFDFGDGIVPMEEGTYPFTLKVKDGQNYFGSVSGEVAIKRTFVIENANSVIECEDATFDDDAKDIELKQETRKEKFNNEKVVSVCTLKNGANVESNGYIYTVRVKASSDVNSVKLYKVGVSGYTEVAIRIEDGYFVFNVDNFESEYVITTDVKKLSLIGYIVFAVCGVLVLGLALLVVVVVRHPRRKRLAKVLEVEEAKQTSTKQSKQTKSKPQKSVSTKTKKSKATKSNKKDDGVDDFHVI